MVLNLGCPLGSPGEFSKFLISGPNPRDADFIGHGSNLDTDIFKKLPRESDGQLGLKTTVAILN